MRPPAEAPNGREHHLERVADAAIVQVYADDFAALPLNERILAWHLTQAAIAGRDIYYDQRYRHALDMRDVLEAVLTCPGDTAGDTLRPIAEYAKLFYINTGPHLSSTAAKFTLGCAPRDLELALMSAADAGARIPVRPGERIADLVRRLSPMFFDPACDPYVTSKTPGPGQDILTASANNLYSGVSLAMLDGFKERYPSNSRLALVDGRLVEEVYREGGRYGGLIETISAHLRRAIPLATPTMANALNALVRVYQTGEDADRRQYDIAWVRDTESPVDTINGFIEVHLDARGIKTAWEGLVYFVSPTKTSALQRLAARAADFEARMPFDAKYRRPSAAGVSARAIEVVTATGEAGPLVPFGINLPNDHAVRQEYGSKSVWLANVNEAFDLSLDPRFWSEFAWSSEEGERARTHGPAAREILTSLHEVIGHASGRMADRVAMSPQEALREYYSAIEEARADLVALYLLADPLVAEIGLAPAERHGALVQAAYESFTRDALVQLRRLRSGLVIELDHMRSRQLIVGWMRDDRQAIEVRERDGRTFYVMLSAGRFRAAAGRLLAIVQQIKSEGDYEAARLLIERYATRADARLRDEVVARASQLNLRSYSGCVMPKLNAVTAPDGTITDVTISYPRDLIAQMLEYSSMSPRRSGENI